MSRRTPTSSIAPARWLACATPLFSSSPASTPSRRGTRLASINEFAPVADVRVVEARLTEDQAYAGVEKARDTAVERGVALAQGVVVEGTAVDAVTLVTLETEADLVIVGSKGVDSLFGRIFGAVSVQVLRKSKCDVLVVVP